MDNNQTQTPAQPGQGMEVLPKSSKYDEALEMAEKSSLDFMNPKRWAIMQAMASTFIQSGALPESISNAPRLIMVFQAGFEAGLKPLEAINSFYFVNGKLSMYGDTVISQVQRAGHIVEWGTCDADTATVTITRGDNKKSLTQTITMAIAKTRGWNMGKNGEKDVWKKYPENMLRYRAFGMCARFIVPDALRGIAIKEEIEGEIDPEEAAKKEKKSSTAAAAAVDVPAHKPLTEALDEADKKALEEKAAGDGKKVDDVEPKTPEGKKIKTAFDKSKEKVNEGK